MILYSVGNGSDEGSAQIGDDDNCDELLGLMQLEICEATEVGGRHGIALLGRIAGSGSSGPPRQESSLVSSHCRRCGGERRGQLAICL